MSQARDEIIDFVKEHLTAEQLYEFIILLDKVDTESRKDTVSYMNERDYINRLKWEGIR